MAEPLAHGAQHIETVRVESADFADGFAVINKDEFDPKVHRLFKDKPAAKLPESGKA